MTYVTLLHTSKSFARKFYKLLPGVLWIMEQIGVGYFKVTNKHKKYVKEVLNSSRLSYGPYTKKFEQEFSNLHGVKYSCFCNSGTSALCIAIATLRETENWHDGDEILCPALTFIATSNMILDNNLVPVFVDVEPEYYGIDPEKIEEKITAKTKAIMAVHLFGLPCDMDPIMELAKKHNLKVIEDSCETMFVHYKGKPVGSFGDISCFSTYMAHLITTGVGGFACTNNLKYAEILRSLINHGRNNIYLAIDDDKGKSEQELKEIVSKRFNFIRFGYSFRATEMESALGIAELEGKDRMMKKRKHNAKYLTKRLKKFSKYLQLPKMRKDAEHAFMMFPIVIKDQNSNKQDLIYFLEKNNIETRDMVPLINQPVYVAQFGNLEEKYPVTANINKNGFFIGCHQGITKDQLNYIISKFEEFYSNRD